MRQDHKALVPHQNHTHELPPRGFVVEDRGKVPAIGETGITSQAFCPRIQDDCKGPRCMFWVELFMSDGRRVAHCADYWNAVQLTDIKTQLIAMNQRLDQLLKGPHAQSIPRERQAPAEATP